MNSFVGNILTDLIHIGLYVSCALSIVSLYVFIYLWDGFRFRNVLGRMRVRTNWKAEGGSIIQYGPARATYAGYLMEHIPTDPLEGWVGIVDDRLLFSAIKSDYKRLGTSTNPTVSNASISLAGIRWLCLSGENWITSPKAFIGYQANDSYSIHVFPQLPWACVNHMTARCPAIRVESSAIDPTLTVLYQQHIHGHWEQTQEGLIYLAPDSVWLNGYVLFMLDQLTQIRVLPADEIPLIKDVLLRVDYTASDGTSSTTGFSMLQAVAHLWAEQLHTYSGVEFTLIEGRKKKPKG